MDIFILSEGKEIGPFSKETAQTLIAQGSVAAADLAWASGMEDWVPLSEILSPGKKSDPSDSSDLSDQSDQSDDSPTGSATSAPAGEPPPEAKLEIEPATPKQRAFLRYLAIAVPEDLSKENASILLNDAMEDPAFAERIGKWSAERLRLHPDLFAAEIHARKEDRANHFFDICQTEGSQFFTRITKAHCQVLVGFLDARFSTWDSRMEDAATNYFFPAIAEKFPQLVERQWRGRFHYVQEPGTEPLAPAARLKKRPITPLQAIVRGFVIGLAILGALYIIQRMVPHWMGLHAAETESFKRVPLASPTLSEKLGNTSVPA